MKRDRHKARARVVVVLVLLSALAGCSLEPSRELWVLDSPEYHVQNGWRMLDRGQATLAVREFEMAKAYHYAPCYFGLGVACAEQGKFDLALESMLQAKAKARHPTQLLQARVAAIRIFTKAHAGGHAPPEWLHAVEQELAAAQQLNPSDPSLYYVLALAYKSGNRFKKAIEAFEKVLELSAAYVPEAKTELASLTERARVSR